MKMITVTNGKGGTGKTTTAVYLALAACRSHPDSRVCLMDLDPQRSAMDWANIATQNDDPLPFDVAYGSVPKLRGLSASDDYDYVVVDVAPAVSDSALRSLVGLSDLLVVPTEAEGLALAQTYHVIDICGDKAVVLLTRVRRRTRIFSDALRTLDDEGIVRFDTSIPDSVRYKSYGMTPDNVGEYAAVWIEIEEELNR